MSSLIEMIDAEIDRLQQVRRLVAQAEGVSGQLAETSSKVGRRPGRQPGKPAKTVAAKRTLSPEARKRIADAQKKRWAATKKLASHSAAKKAAKKGSKAAAATAAKNEANA